MTRTLAVLPFLILAALILLAALYGAWQTVAWPTAAAIGQAALATLFCLILALPAAAGPLTPWLLPLWLTPAIGAAGWALLPLPTTPATSLARATTLCLPLMVLALGSAQTRIPASLTRAAAGAGLLTRARLILRFTLPTIAASAALVFILQLLHT